MENFKLWEKEIPLYNEKFQNEHNEGAASVDAYMINDEKKHSAVVIFPGGGYNHRARHEGEDVAKWFNSIGINAFVVNYRVYPYVHPVEITDAKRAVRYIRFNADKLNVYADKIGIIGFSAGAHLAGCVAEHYDEFDADKADEIDNVSAKPDMLCLCYPVVTLCESYGHIGSREYLLKESTNLILDLSLEKNIRDDMPPVFMWHTFEDKSVPVINSIEMAKALKEKNIPFELHIFPEGKHGLGLAKEVKGADMWTGLFKSWLERTGFINRENIKGKM